MFTITALCHFFAIGLSPQGVSTSPAPSKPTPVIHFKESLELLKQEDSDIFIAEPVSEDDEDSEDDRNTSPNSSAIFSAGDDNASDTSSISGIPIGYKATYTTFYPNAHIDSDHLYLEASNDLMEIRARVSSAVPCPIFDQCDSPAAQNKLGACGWVYNVDESLNYDERFLTPWARQKAENLSREVHERANQKARDLATKTPQVYLAPRNRVGLSELKDHLHSSRLNSS